MLKELSGSNSSEDSKEKKDTTSDKRQQIIAILVVIFYGILSICLLIAAFISQSLFLLPVVPLIARYWAHPFRKAVDKLLPSK